MSVKWYKVKNGVIRKISEPASIESFLDKGYTITKVTENEFGSKSEIRSYSPLTRQEAFDKQKGIRQDNATHPGYSADYTPATNYTKGRHAGRSPEQIVEELNALYVLNENKNPSIARSWKMSRDFASKMIPYIS